MARGDNSDRAQEYIENKYGDVPEGDEQTVSTGRSPEGELSDTGKDKFSIREALSKTGLETTKTDQEY